METIWEAGHLSSSFVSTAGHLAAEVSQYQGISHLKKKCQCQGLARGEGMGATRIYRCQPPITTILDKSPWDRTVIFIFSVISRLPLKTACTSVLFEIFLPFSLPPPYTKLKLGKNSRPTLFLGWGEGLSLCELENAPGTQKCPKPFVHDCS